jgi:hypothetical protein
MLCVAYTALYITKALYEALSVLTLVSGHTLVRMCCYLCTIGGFEVLATADWLV